MMSTIIAVNSNAAPATAIYGNREISIEKTLDDPNDLWVMPADLTRINGFVIKPEGACLDEVCIPIRENDTALSVKRDSQQWFNVSELARRINQGSAADTEKRVFAFDLVPSTLGGFLNSAVAPDFELKDRSGKTVHLSDFKGKKVLLVTWASW